MSDRRNFIQVVTATAVLLAACSPGATGSPTAPQAVTEPAPQMDDNRIPLIVDYSPTVSDVPALLLLTQRPDVLLLGVTVPGTGESECDPAVEHTRAILVAVGHAEVPVACGTAEPIGPGAEWPAAWRDSASELAGIDLPATSGNTDLDAPDLLIQLTKGSGRPAVIVALAPLTNVAEALGRDSELPDRVRMLYTMGGALKVAGNAPGGVAEWNYFIDPTAVSRVLESGMNVSMIPLDATNHVPANKRWFYALSRHHVTPAADIVYRLWEAARPFEFPGFYFWDELAALAAVDDSVVSWETVEVFAEVAGPFAGEVRIAPGNRRVRVATGASGDAFESALLIGLNGGLEPPELVVPDEDVHFFEQMEAARSKLNHALGALFESDQAGEAEPLLNADRELTADEAATLRAYAIDFWRGLFDAGLAYHDELQTITAPSALAGTHGAYLDALAGWIDTRDRWLADLESVDADQIAERFWDPGPDFEAVDSACAVLEEEAARRDLFPAICDTDG